MGLTWICYLILASTVLTEDDPLSSIVKLRVSQCHRPESALELRRIYVSLIGLLNQTVSYMAIAMGPQKLNRPVIEIHRVIESVQIRRTAPQPKNVNPFWQ